ncbi:MAG: hypothetical protein EXS42_05060 [Lacunisphaera sp.]|nr:hypothetical protein [Lacunisphaera sp.]
MTALVSSFDFGPMVMTTVAGVEMQRQLATVVVGGLLTSTFRKLVLPPVLHVWLEGKFGRGPGGP